MPKQRRVALAKSADRTAAEPQLYHTLFYIVSLQYFPIADCDACAFDALSRIPDCEVISQFVFPVRFVAKRYILQQKYLRK